MANPTPRALVLRGATGTVREGIFHGRPHIVVPVVAMVQGVIHPANAPEPEFVPGTAFQTLPEGWNGRPVMHNHPWTASGPVSANSPTVLETAIGTVFGAQAEEFRLLMEAWIDPSRVPSTDAKGLRTLERLRAGEVIEISVGTFVTLSETPGVYNGKKYARSWQMMAPDHLALLEEGDKGACSVQMGCGTPRTAKIHLVTARGLEPEGGDTNMADQPMALSALLDGVVSWVKTLRVSNDEHDCKCRGEHMKTQAERIKALIDSPKTPWAAADQKTLEGMDDARLKVLEAALAEPATIDPARKQKIDAIIADPANPFAEADRGTLEAMPEERLSELKAWKAATSPTPTPAPAPAPAPAPTPAPAPAPAPLTEDQFMAQAPQPLRDMVARAKAADATLRTSLITSLKAAQQEYNEAELTAMPTDQLERMSRVAKVAPAPVDFSVRGVPRVNDGKPQPIPEPPSLDDKIRAARGITKAS